MKKFAVKFNIDGKVESKSTLSDRYLNNPKYKDDPSNPLNQGYELRDNLDGLEFVDYPVKTDKERVMEVLGITQANLDKLKTLSVTP